MRRAAIATVLFYAAVIAAGMILGPVFWMALLVVSAIAFAVLVCAAMAAKRSSS
jgi:hypothetical protein